METRHLHRDYQTAFCGIDISYVLATHERAETDCAACIAAADRAAKDEERARLEEEAHMAERALAEAEALAAAADTEDDHADTT